MESLNNLDSLPTSKKTAQTSSPSNICGPPRLLVSVRDKSEALAAMEGGADWIDLKEPSRGPLGAPGVEDATSVVAVVASRCPVSAALGEMVEWEASFAKHLLEVPGIAAVKIGLAGSADLSDWSVRWRSLASEVISSGRHLVAVAYADWGAARAPAISAVIHEATKLHCRYLLLDTYDKQAGAISDHLSHDEFTQNLRLAKQGGLQTVVAGGLTIDSLSRLPATDIDLLAVRGGVCVGRRIDRICSERTARFRKAMRDRWPT